MTYPSIKNTIDASKKIFYDERFLLTNNTEINSSSITSVNFIYYSSDSSEFITKSFSGLEMEIIQELNLGPNSPYLLYLLLAFPLAGEEELNLTQETPASIS